MISVLIVIYNPDDELHHCIKRLINISADVPLEIIVVDNHSTNEVAQVLPQHFPQIKVIRSNKNLGFGGGNNLAFAHSSGDYVMCVNPDLMLTQEALRALLEAIQDNPQVGVVGPRTYDSRSELIDTARADYTLMRICVKYLGISLLIPSLLYGPYRRKMRTETAAFETDWLQGSCLLMRRQTFETLNGFDDDFFLYMEDTDLCYRIRQSGLKVLYVPQAVVEHIGGTTTSRYHTLRVHSFHHSPILYQRKRGNIFGVIVLKFVFMIELCAKIVIRTVLNLIRYNQDRSQRRNAEINTLTKVWFF